MKAITLLLISCLLSVASTGCAIRGQFVISSNGQPQYAAGFTAPGTAYATDFHRRTVVKTNFISTVPVAYWYPPHEKIAYGRNYYSWPLAEPFLVVTNGPHGKGNAAVDLRAAVGTQVLAAADGAVVHAGWDNQSGNKIVIQHRGSQTAYCHLSKMYVADGQKVVRGQVIGLSGDTGWDCRGAHLHFAVYGGHNPFANEPLGMRIYPAHRYFSAVQKGHEPS